MLYYLAMHEICAEKGDGLILHHGRIIRILRYMYTYYMYMYIV